MRGGRSECDIETREMDLDRLDAGLFEGLNLVTASALLDLCRSRGCGVSRHVVVRWAPPRCSRSRMTGDRRATLSSPRTTWCAS